MPGLRPTPNRLRRAAFISNTYVAIVSAAVARTWNNPTVFFAHGTEYKVIHAELAQRNRLVIGVDNGKLCGAVVKDKAIDIEALGPATLTSGEPVSIFLDHHNPVPADAKGKVGAELVLHYFKTLRNIIKDALKNNYEIVAVAHHSPFDPDAMIGQWLVKELINISIKENFTGKPANLSPVYTALAGYAKLTDFYQHTFSPSQHLTLRGICDGLAKISGNNPFQLSERSNKILNWIVKNNLDPNDFNGFRHYLERHILGRKFAAGSVESLIQDCIRKKAESLSLAREIVEKTRQDSSKTFDLTLLDSNGKALKTKLMLIDDPAASDLTKEIDDVVYGGSDSPVIIKKTPDGQWWVTLRPSNYNTENGPMSDPVLKAIQPPTFAFAPKTAGFHEQIVARLVKLAKTKGLPESIWAIWPYNGTAEQPLNGGFGHFTGQEIVNAILGH